MRFVIGLCSILCLSSAAVTAAEAASDERIAALVQDLGAEEYPVRMRTVEAFFAIGEPARKALEEAVKKQLGKQLGTEIICKEFAGQSI